MRKAQIFSRLCLISLLLVIGFSLTAPTSVSQDTEEKINVAVLILEVSGGVPETYAVALTNRLRQELFLTGAFKVMERVEMDEILKEIGFQQTGCTSNECVVQAGRILGVDHMVAGTVSRMGELHSITLRLIEVETSEIMKMETVDCICTIEEVMTMRLKEAARKITGLEAEGFSPAGNMIGRGNIKLTSEPSGAKVYLDGNETEFTTPITLEGISTGLHVIRLVKENMIGSMQVYVMPNVTSEVEIPLKTGYGSVTINSKPSGTEAYLDGEYIGITPVRLDTVLAGGHCITFKHVNMSVRNKYFHLSLNQTLNLEVPLLDKREVYLFNEMEFVYIPGRILNIAGEKQIKDFFIQKTELTQAQWKRIMGKNPAKHKDNNNPVENVSFIKVLEFIDKLNEIEGCEIFRLPTIYEWEYACRAGSKGKYCFGNDENLLDEYAWYKKNSGKETHPVATKNPNDFGIYDMHGNVWEWCFASMTDSINYNQISYLTFIMGGSYKSKTKNLTCVSIKAENENEKFDDIGFRLVRIAE